MDSVTQVQILDKVVRISQSTNTLTKDMNLTILPTTLNYFIWDQLLILLPFSLERFGSFKSSKEEPVQCLPMEEPII